MFLGSSNVPQYWRSRVPRFGATGCSGFKLFILKVNYSCYAPWSPKVSRVSRGFFSSHLTSFVISLFHHVSFGFKRNWKWWGVFFGCKSRLRKSRSEDKLSFLRDAQLEGSVRDLNPKKDGNFEGLIHALHKMVMISCTFLDMDVEKKPGQRAPKSFWLNGNWCVFFSSWEVLPVPCVLLERFQYWESVTCLLHMKK